VPIYAFSCGQCGPFEVTRGMAQAAAPISCPSCGGVARRLFTPPALALLSKPVRGLLDLEQKSAHEPAVVSEKTGRPRPHTHEPTPPWMLSH
jgi:putative FmdB family regulatory protein